MPGKPVEVRRGVWSYVVEGKRDPLTGRRRQYRRTFEGGKRGAIEAQAKLQTEVAAGKYASAGVTVAEVLEAWFAQAGPDLSPSTRESTRIVIDRHLVPHLGAVKLAKLRTVDIDAAYVTLRARGSKKGKALSPATVKRAHGILHRALEQAVRWEWLTSNPAGRASPPKVTQPPITPPSPEVVAKLIAAAGEDFRPLLRLAAMTGARRGELCALRWRDIDTEASTVRFGRAVVAIKGELVVKEPKNASSVRSVALDAETMELLERYQLRLAERMLATGATLTPNTYVFPAELDGTTPLRPDGVTHRFEKVCEALGVAGVRFHDLRHFAATELIGAGVDVRTVAGRLGHAGGGRTTLAVYAHFLTARDQGAADVLAARLKPKAAKRQQRKRSK